VGFLERAEVRDVLAWMRLLVDPQDASAVVRALARPPIELRQVDLARVIQLARRRKLDLVLGLTAATESPQVPPEARERIGRFLELHASAAAELDTVEPDEFVARLIDRLSARGRPLLTPQDAAGQRASLESLHGLAVDFVQANPQSDARELAGHLAAVVPEARWESPAIGDPTPLTATPPAPGDARPADGENPPAAYGETPPAADRETPPAADGETPRAERPDELAATLGLLREEVLASVGRIGGRLGELRLDTELDVSHGVVRFLELLKLSALLQRSGGQSVAEALADLNARLLAATTPLQRDIFLTSTLDETLLASSPDDRARAQAIAPREEHSLGPFLPRKGVGLALSASDIQTYRSCPLRYKFARVLRIPTEQTVHQRFGIVVHQVLERYHSEGGSAFEQMLDLFDAGWRRAGFGESEHERELRRKALAALTRYHERLGEQASEPVWFERAFSFRLGPHHLRGRVDRVDRITGGDPPNGEPNGKPNGEPNGGANGKPNGEPNAGANGKPNGKPNSQPNGEQEYEYELIDYKTGRPRTAEQLEDDIQLSLYALAAREDWQLESSRQAYYYVLDDLRVPVPRSERDGEAVKDIVLEVGEGILAQDFGPTPSRAACSICDYRIVCPAAEK
jgi:DNA helicase-2/ATP-dependent DNA helicase PcrA